MTRYQETLSGDMACSCCSEALMGLGVSIFLVAYVQERGGNRGAFVLSRQQQRGKSCFLIQS